MLPPQTQSGKAVLDSLTLLSKELKFYSEGFKATKKLKGTIDEINQIKRGVSTATQSTKQLEKQFKSAEQNLKGVKKITDAIQKGLFKDLGGNWSKYGSILNGLAGIAQAGFTAFLVLKQGEMQAIDIETQNVQNSAIANTFTKAINNSIQIQNTRKDIEAFKRKTNDSIDKAFANIGSISTNARVAREKANDALYEVRQGRQILEAKIAKLTPNVGDIQKQVNATVSGIRAEFQKQVDKISSDLKAQLNKPQVQPATKEDLQKVTADVQKIATTVNNFPATIQKTFDTTQNTIKQVVDRAIAPIAKIGESWGITVTPATITPATVTPSQGGGVTVTPATVTPATVTPARFSSSAIGQQVTQQIKQETSGTDAKINTLAGGLSAVGTAAQQAVTIANQAKIDANRKTLDPRVDDLYERIRRQEKVNEEGNRKLDILIPKIDSILPTIAGIPLIAGKAADLIKPNLLTAPDIEKATGVAMCRNLQTGCGRKAIDDAVGNVVNNNNQNTGSLLDKLNAGLTAADLVQNTEMLNTINNKLGDQLPGGISGKLERFSKWLHLDRALNLMIWATTIHNALMLSNDIGQTLLGAISNVFQLFGLKDSEGNAFDLGSIISSSIENLIKGLIGADNYTELREAWAKANRIYQATINIFNALQGLSSAILTGLEMTAGKIGKIGNALRKSGEVLETAYSWMNPQPKFNRITQTLESLQNGASTIQMVTQAPLDIINATTELTTATTELTNALKEDNKPENKGKESPEPEHLKATESTAKLASSGLEMIEADLEADE